MRRRNLLFPEPEPDRGESVAEMEDSVTVCGCTGVTKGAIIQAIHQKGVRTLAQLKESTRASTGCGSCSGSCQQILKAVSPDFEEETKKLLCKCVPFTQENLREIILSQRLKSVQNPCSPIVFTRRFERTSHARIARSAIPCGETSMA